VPRKSMGGAFGIDFTVRGRNLKGMNYPVKYGQKYLLAVVILCLRPRSQSAPRRV